MPTSMKLPRGPTRTRSFADFSQGPYGAPTPRTPASNVSSARGEAHVTRPQAKEDWTMAKL